MVRFYIHSKISPFMRPFPQGDGLNGLNGLAATRIAYKRVEGAALRAQPVLERITKLRSVRYVYALQKLIFCMMVNIFSNKECFILITIIENNINPITKLR